MSKKASRKNSESLVKHQKNLLEKARQEIEALKDSEGVSRSVLEVSPNPIVTYDIEGKVQYLNDAFTKAFGWTLDSVKGKRIDFVPDENMPETIDAIEQLARAGQVEIETRRHTKDKRILDVELSCGSYKNKDNVIIGNVSLVCFWGIPVKDKLSFKFLSEFCHSYLLRIKVNNQEMMEQQELKIKRIYDDFLTCIGCGVLTPRSGFVQQAVIRSILTRLGFQNHAANDGEKALKELEKNNYDLVLMDVQMPVMDGYECAEHIRAVDSKVLNRNIPIVALTAHAMKADMDKCISAGMNDYTTKPIDRNTLIRKINKLLF